MILKRTVSILVLSFFASMAGLWNYAETQEANETVSAELAGRPLQQVAITTGDLPLAIDFYSNRLGLPFLFESNNMAFFDMAGIRLMVVYDDNRLTAKPTSILYFEVEDFHTVLPV